MSNENTGRKPLTDQSIIEALETLAAAFPWDKCDIWISREPEGQVTFTGYVPANQELRAESVFGHGANPAEAVSHAIKTASPARRDPEIMRQQTIREMEEKLEQLKGVVIGLPPYRPGYYLAAPAQAVDV